MTTWKELQETLPTGLSIDALETIRKSTAASRHCARVQATLAAAREIAGDDDAICSALMQIDSNGVGGIADAGAAFGPPSTKRMSWASSLGSGRRNASDGEAYMAALIAAINVLPPSVVKPPVMGALFQLLREEDYEFLAAYCRKELARAAERGDLGLVSEWDKYLRLMKPTAS